MNSVFFFLTEILRNVFLFYFFIFFFFGGGVGYWQAGSFYVTV